MSLILDCILHDRKGGLQLLESYRYDRSHDVSDAIIILKKFLLTEVLDDKYRIDVGDLFDDILEQRASFLHRNNVSLVDVVRRIFSKNLPKSRDFLFYYMVMHLSKYPEIKRYLQIKYIKSRRSYQLYENNTGRLVYDFESEIRERLA
jgi:hypothetical protein